MKANAHHLNIETGGTKQILYFSHNIIDGTPLNNLCRLLLQSTGIPIVSVTHKPIALGQNIVVDMAPGQKAYHRQIAIGLKACTADIIYFCEHDCLYHPSHFELVPTHYPIMFNRNQYRCCGVGAYKTSDSDHFMSVLIGRREALMERMADRLGFVMKEHIGGLHLKTIIPVLDIRHKRCSSTPFFRSWKDHLQRPIWMKRKIVHNLSYWGNVTKLRKWLLDFKSPERQFSPDVINNSMAAKHKVDPA